MQGVVTPLAHRGSQRPEPVARVVGRRREYNEYDFRTAHPGMLHRHIDGQYEVPISDIANESNYRILDQFGNYVRGEDYRGPVFVQSTQVPELPQAVRLGLESDAENLPPTMIESLARDEARVARNRRVREMQSQREQEREEYNERLEQLQRADAAREPDDSEEGLLFSSDPDADINRFSSKRRRVEQSGRGIIDYD